MANGLLSPNPLDDPDYDYGTILPFRQRNMLDVDELSTDVTPEFAVPGLLRDVANSAVRMGQMARNERAPGLLIGDVMDFSPAGLLNRIPVGALGMNVFHGTPNLFKPEPDFPQGRPRLDKMGTGEGVQAYGPGFYSAEAPKVAKTYQSKVSAMQGGPTATIDGRPIDWNDPFETAAFELARHNGDRAAAADFHARAFKGGDKNPAVQILRSEQKLPEVTLPGSLYKLDIPDADAAKFLDYDAPLKEQPKSVRDALKAYGNYPDNMKGSQIYEVIASSLAKPPFDNTVASTKNPSAAQAASDALREMGIPGLRYLDRGSRDGSDGTRNFVVWDQDVLDRTKILQRNDETFEAAPGVPAMGLLNSDNDDRPGGTNLLGLYTGGVI